MIRTLELPHSIDWGKLEFRLSADRDTLSAHWGDFCIAAVVAETPADRPKLIEQLKREVQRQQWNDAARPAGAGASRDFDEMFSELSTIFGPDLSAR